MGSKRLEARAAWPTRRWPGCAVLLLSLLGLVPAAIAEPAPPVSLDTFVAQIAAARQLTAACTRLATACDASSLPRDERISGAPGGDFSVTWGWLRDALSGAGSASAADRARSMKDAQVHLAELLADAFAIPAAASAGTFQKARTAAAAALARGEFSSSDGPTWWQRHVARLQDWILRLFTGMDRLGRRAPWLAPLIEWSCFLLAAGGLLWFVRRSLARQALRIALGDGAALAARGDRDSADWAALAQRHAAVFEWRDAVHCLYWAAISLMESRRAWRRNVTRTPREYLALLQPGSAAQHALRDLTRGFERVWYGQSAADEAQYLSALSSFRQLEAAKPERSVPSSSDQASLTPAGAA